jgi:hypothetical protein
MTQQTLTVSSADFFGDYGRASLSHRGVQAPEETWILEKQVCASDPNSTLLLDDGDVRVFAAIGWDGQKGFTILTHKESLELKLVYTVI